jgi:hypothetical protein
MSDARRASEVAELRSRLDEKSSPVASVRDSFYNLIFWLL